jgi:hypothetical protein
MSNSIVRVEVRDRAPAPTQAEVWVRVVPARQDAGTEVRGRLVGPSCAYAATVEVAYPLLPLGPNAAPPPGGITRRVVIPEASLWETQSPFLYRGPVELWQDGRRCDRAEVTHGLRALGLGPRGLHLGGKPLALCGREHAGDLDEEEARGLRRAGRNLLVAGIEDAATLAGQADRLGFLVLARLAHGSEDALAGAAALAEHPCCLGWLVPADADFRDRLPAAGLVGALVHAGWKGPPPQGVHFLAGPAAEAGALAALGRPLLLYGDAALPAAGPPILGTVIR